MAYGESKDFTTEWLEKKIQFWNSLFGNEHLDGKNSHEDEGNAAQRVVQTLHFREAEL